MYTKNDLDKKVNEDETLLQFIQNSHKEFYDTSITREEVEQLSVEDLNGLIEHLDDLWTK